MVVEPTVVGEGSPPHRCTTTTLIANELRKDDASPTEFGEGSTASLRQVNVLTAHDEASRCSSTRCRARPPNTIRIDLYDTTRGIVLGEFTPGPSRRDVCNAKWDARLTKRWFEAVAEIEAGVRSGRVVPLGLE